MLLNYLAVGAGGFLGSILRYTLNLFFPDTGFPITTLAINVIGSFAMGLFAAMVLSGFIQDQRLSLFLRVGLCGGFSTMAAFSVQSLHLIQQGDYALAVLYVAVTGALCIAAAFAGDCLVNMQTQR